LKRGIYQISLIILLFFYSSTLIFAQRNQTHRLGFKGGIFAPSVKSTHITGIELEAQFDAVIHPHVDAGPRFGLFIREIEDIAINGEKSKFIIVPITFQFRFYPFYSDEKGATHGIIAPYLGASAGYYFALLTETNKLDVAKVPDGLGGFGGNVCVGIDFGFGPSTAYFVELSYRKTGTRSQRGYELDLDGFTLSLGGRF
jgi:hypothetical protein